MFLHIGNNITILKEDIVAIIDKKSVENSKDTKVFIENIIKNGWIYSDNHKDIRTYIITCIRKMDRKNREYTNEYKLYTSSISSTTMFKRGAVNL